jgi:hypothetical protein
VPYRAPTPDEQARAVAALAAVRAGHAPDLTDLPLRSTTGTDRAGHPFTLLSDNSTPVVSRESRSQPPRVSLSTTPSSAFVHTEPDRLARLLRPSPPNLAAPGWGHVAVHESTDLLIEVPHPGSDRYTARLGLELFHAIPTAALLVAGTHRNTADVAHLPESLFQTYAQAFATTELQLHGFATASAPGTDVVLSPGAGKPTRLHEALEKALTRQGFRVAHHEHLAGRTNVQGIAAAVRGTPFLHLELAALVRRDHRDRVVDAVTDAWHEHGR